MRPGYQGLVHSFDGSPNEYIRKNVDRLKYWKATLENDTPDALYPSYLPLKRKYQAEGGTEFLCSIR